MICPHTQKECNNGCISQNECHFFDFKKIFKLLRVTFSRNSVK